MQRTLPESIFEARLWTSITSSGIVIRGLDEGQQPVLDHASRLPSEFSEHDREKDSNVCPLTSGWLSLLFAVSAGFLDSYSFCRGVRDPSEVTRAFSAMILSPASCHEGRLIPGRSLKSTI